MGGWPIQRFIEKRGVWEFLSFDTFSSKGILHPGDDDNDCVATKIVHGRGRGREKEGGKGGERTMKELRVLIFSILVC